MKIKEDNFFCRVVSSIAPIHKEPSYSSEMISQALFFEKLEILKDNQNINHSLFDLYSLLESIDCWILVRMEDGYIGWIKTLYIKKCNEINEKRIKAYSQSRYNHIKDDYSFSYIVKNMIQPIITNYPNTMRLSDYSISYFKREFTFLSNFSMYKYDYRKSYLSFGTRVFINIDADNIKEYQKYNIFPVVLPDFNHFGFIHCKHPDLIFKQLPKSSIDSQKEHIKILSTNLVGVPYLWGGRSVFGYDCSGFVQSVFNTACNIKLKRDCCDMYNDLKQYVIDINDTDLGDLLFFENKDGKIDHVGIVIDKYMFIHCSGQVKINSFIKNIDNYYDKIDNYNLIFVSTNSLFYNYE